MTPSVESRALEAVAERYRARGYQVEVHPAPETLPKFLEGHRPDVIARKQDDFVVIELKVGTRTASADRLRPLAERVSREEGWRLAVVFVDAATAEISESDPLSPAAAAERVEQADALARQGQTEAAFLLLWSSLEALLRSLAERAHLPLSNLPPTALIRELYSAGEVSREDYDLLLRLLPTRNQIVHGFGVSNGLDLGDLQKLARELVQELSAPT